MNRMTLLLPAAAIIVAGLLSSVFIVDERTKALVLQFGQITSVKDEPGLYFKIPLIQEIVRYDDRILGRDIEPLEVTPSDDRRLVVDAFARYRIADVVRFRQAVGAGGVQAGGHCGVVPCRIRVRSAAASSTGWRKRSRSKRVSGTTMESVAIQRPRKS